MGDQATNLAEMMNVDRPAAEEALQRNGHDVQKALDFLLRAQSETQGTAAGSSFYDHGRNPSTESMPPLMPAEEPPEIQKAVQMSMMEDIKIQQPTPQSFYNMDNSGDWAGVPPNLSTQDDSLQKAVAQSLADFQQQDADDIPQNIPIRKDGQPVALFPTQPERTHVALLLQSLFYIPQVRAAIASLEIPTNPENPVYKAQQLFASMDLTRQSILVDNDDSFSSFPGAPLDGNERPTKKTQMLLYELGNSIEKASAELHRLFTFGHAHITHQPHMADKIHKNASLSCIVPIARAVPPLESFGPRVHTTSMEASLVTQLSTYYSDSDEPWAEHDVIYEESDVLAFLPAPPDDFNPHDPKPLDVFTFPENLYIDSFLFSNFKLTQKKRTEIGQIAVDLNRLKAEKATVVEKEQKYLPSLRSSHHYFENETSHGQKTTAKLQAIITHIEATITETAAEITVLQQQAAEIFDTPELQKHPYDLRSVLMHTGLPGRKQYYSYIQDERQRWWKTSGYEVTEVTKAEVFTDTTGCALGAGPYLLVYSKRVPPAEQTIPTQWPQEFSTLLEDPRQPLQEIRSNTPDSISRPPANTSPGSRRKLPNPREAISREVSSESVLKD